MTKVLPIPGFDGYHVDENGVVYGKQGQPLKQVTKKQKPYLTVGLMRNGKCITKLVHHLVLEAFDGPRPQGLEGRHLDGDRFNNRRHNLCWGTAKENTADSIRLGVHPPLPYVTKVPPIMRPALLVMRAKGASYTAIGVRFGISKQQARRLVLGVTSGVRERLIQKGEGRGQSLAA